jgi:phytoene dehydrogenase-like protein
LKTAILGAGVSGLSLARFLIEGGLDPASVHLFEADRVVGGLCRSKTVDGFTFDVAGGHILYSKDAPAMQWMKDCAGGDQAFVKRDRHTRIRFEDRWVNYPFENGLGDLPPQANFDCLRGYVEALPRLAALQADDEPVYYRLMAAFCDWAIALGAARGYAELGTAPTVERTRMDALAVIEYTPIGFEPLLPGQDPAERLPRVLRAECDLAVLRGALAARLEVLA